MTEENQNEEETTFKVADRRKFNVDGSLREGVIIDDAPTRTEPTAATDLPGGIGSSNLQINLDAAVNRVPDVSEADAADIFESDENETFAPDFQSNVSENSTETEAITGDEQLDELNFPGAENPASFANFLLSLASQAAAAMGLTENPMTGGRRADLETSRYWLEILAMLREKTTGNLHPQEQKLFDGLLSDLRMQYVQLARAADAQMRKQEEQLIKNAQQKFSGKDILGK